MWNTNLKGIQLFIPTVKEANKLFGNINVENVDGLNVVKDYNIIITGCGKVATAVSLSRYLMKNKDYLPVLAGIAGAYRSSKAKVGEVYYVQDDYFVDEAIYSPTNYQPLRNMAELELGICKDNKVSFFIPNNRFPVCSANTVSLIPNDDFISNIYHKKTGALIESMEGASFGYTASTFNIPAIHIRSVSNFCGRREEQKWDIDLAIKNLRKALFNLLD